MLSEGLRRLALKAITGPGGTPRSIRLANHAVQAIADAALPASITELLKAERGTGHGTLLRQIRRSIDALAAAQGLTRDELLERAVEDHGLGPDGTTRRPLADSWLAVGTVRGTTGQTASVTVTIKDQSGAGKVAATITLEGIDSRITLRDLIRTRVREQVARYNATLADIFQGLVMPDGA